MSSNTGPNSSSSSASSSASSLPSPAAPASASSSTVVAREHKKRPWWIWVALAAVALLLLLLGLSQCGGVDNAGSAAPSAPAAGAAPSAAAPGAPASGVNGAAPAAAGAGAAGSLTADGTSLLPVAQVADANGSLAGQVGKSVTAQGVTVQSVPADEGFWVGSSDTDRVWVQLDGKDESGYTVKTGDKVSFTGKVVAHDPGFAPGIDVNADEGADQLTKQAAHIAVPKGALKQFTG